MNGYSLTRLRHVTAMKRTDKAFGMNSKHDLATSEPECAVVVAAYAPRLGFVRPDELMGGKRHTPDPDTHDVPKTELDDGAQPGRNVLPGSCKTTISEELTRKSRPVGVRRPTLERTVGRLRHGVGISHHRAGRKR